MAQRRRKEGGEGRYRVALRVASSTDSRTRWVPPFLRRGGTAESVAGRQLRGQAPLSQITSQLRLMDAFFAWQQNYIDSGFKKHGSGVCWDWIESGQCPSLQSGLPCRHKHPKITLRSDGQGGCEASLSTKVPHWVKLLKGINFTEPNDGYLCDFGKYEGKGVSEIPESYINWCRGKNPQGRMLALVEASDASSSTLTSEEDVPTVVQQLEFLRNVSNIEGSGKAERKAQQIMKQIEEDEHAHQLAVDAMYCEVCEKFNEDCECAYCTECGERKQWSDLRYNDDSHPICDDCWPKCEICGCGLNSDDINDLECETCSDCREEELQKQKEEEQEKARKKKKKRKAEASIMSTPTTKKNMKK